MTFWPTDSSNNEREKEKEEEEEEEQESLSIWLWATCTIYMSLPVDVHVCVCCLPNEASSAGRRSRKLAQSMATSPIRPVGVDELTICVNCQLPPSKGQSWAGSHYLPPQFSLLHSYCCLIYNNALK